MEGKKYDKGKLRWDLLPIGEIEKVVEVITFGAEKYGANNWKNVDSERYYAALMRHLVAWRKGEKVDIESGIEHLAHCIINLIFIMWQENQNIPIKIIDE